MRHLFGVGLLALAAALSAGTSSGSTAGHVRATPTASRFPLRLAPSRHYFVDRRGRPFLLVGDSPQALVGAVSARDAAIFIANRRRYGVTALWVNLLCVKYTGCRDDGATFDGIAPFTKPQDLSTPNPAYFARADAIIRLAAQAGMVVLLDPIETGGWLSVLRANGTAKAYAYGRFLGARYRAFPNVLWFNGNDFQTWRNADDDALVLAVAHGIRSVDKAHLQTVELNYPVSASRDDARWQSLLGFDLAYTYAPTYAAVLHEFERRPPLPVVMGEAGYEFEQNDPSFSRGTPLTLRRQEWWTALSGAAGQLYGNHWTWQFARGWQNHMDTPGSRDLRNLVTFLQSRAWYRLVPDASHSIVTGGYGTFTATGNVDSSSYVTTAATPDRSLVVSYLPQGGSLTVDVARVKRGGKARWFDPTSGRFAGRPVQLPPSGRVTSPGTNASGDPDWVFVLS